MQRVLANMTQKELDAEQKRLWDLRKLLTQQQEAVENLRKKNVRCFGRVQLKRITGVCKK
jgi:hypothetical protein